MEPKVFISYSWSNQNHQELVKHWTCMNYEWGMVNYGWWIENYELWMVNYEWGMGNGG